MAKTHPADSFRIDPPRGRPRKGTKAAGARARSLRLPDDTWLDLEALARARKVSLHRLLRTIVARHLYECEPTKVVRKPARKAHKAA